MSSSKRHKEWREKNRDYWRAYKKAWNRLSRNNPAYPPEFPDNRQLRVNKTRKGSTLKTVTKIKPGHCHNCESILKEGEEKYCKYCLSRYPLADK